MYTSGSRYVTLAPMFIAQSPLKRFYALVQVDHISGCWNWQGSHSNGYGQFVLSALRGQKRIRISPYRFMWEHWNGQPFPVGLEPDHLCRNRRCCNPLHIEPKTHRANMLCGDTIVARNAAKTHCNQGHIFDEGNTIKSPNSRHCAQCRRERQRKWYARTHPDAKPRRKRRTTG